MPRCTSATFKTSTIVSQLIASENHKKLKGAYSHIDVVIGSIRDALVQPKINLMNYLQDFRGLKVHVDYSDDMITNVTEDFLRENNV